ncbi:MAG: carboxypeptidase regulatory-like domain-containing protein [Acidobacteriaceae bacterium]|nr:carboxypeptidase regulatory-like domain-containing protein [Acidobacteriaceae bacterium]
MTSRILVLAVCCISVSASLSMQRDAVVSGTVEGLNGAPGISGAAVSLFSPTQVFQTIADANGGFAFSQVPPGEYQLQALGPGFRRRIVSNVLVPEGTSHPLDLSLEFLKCDLPILAALPHYVPAPGAPVLDGSVRTLGLHKPLRGARVDLLDSASGDVLLSSSTDRGGSFELLNAVAGRYQVRVTPKTYNAVVVSDIWLVSGYKANVIMEVPPVTGKSTLSCQ